MRFLRNLIAASGLLAVFALAQTPSYTLTDLGPAGNPFSQAGFVSNNGVVTGSYTASDGTQHAAVWQGGRLFDIAQPGLGGPNSGAGSINQFGQLVIGGELASKDPNNENFCGFGDGLICLTYVWQFGTATQLPTLGGTNANWGNINERGEVSGFAENANRDPKCPSTPAVNGIGPLMFDYEAVIWGPGAGAVRELKPLAGDSVGAALWVNDKGQAVGTTGSCANVVLPPLAAGPHAVLWDADGTPIDLGNLGGTGDPSILGRGNIGLGINNRGQAVGVSSLTGNKANHAFLWTKQTGMQDLGTLSGDVNSAATAINDRAQVVGQSFGDAGPMMGNPRAFLWENGVMTDLNTLVPANSPLHLLVAFSINSRAEIAGFGVTNDGKIHAYLASPSYLSPAASTSTGATNAVVTPISLTTSEPSIVLDGSASTSASGDLQYLFSVVPGGLRPALLQTPSNSRATVDFTSGPGLYLVQLTVTDAAGGIAKSPVIMLTYQPS
jgi:probable HAF family extracellular repeat protein